MDVSGTQRRGAERTAFILLTDIYRSSHLWEIYPHEYSAALDEHNHLTERLVSAHHGRILKGLGDGYMALFDTASDCVACGVALQAAMAGRFPMPGGAPLRLRVVCHGGGLWRLASAEGDWFGNALNRSARICQVCHPGMVLISAIVRLALDAVPAGCRVTDLGTHHLRDLAEPETLYQLDHPDFAEHEFPALATLNNRPNNLTTHPNAFVGRERELRELAQLFGPGGRRLVTLIAPGGYGKSRLAAQVCANLLDRFEHGVFEVELAPLGNSARIASAAADALGLPLSGLRTPLEELGDYLKNKELLLCLDNFEHLLDGGPPVAALLKAAPRLKVLVTSRVLLKLQEEAAYRLEPLGTSAATEDGELSESQLLFADRATLVNPNFTLADQNLALVSQLCTRLEGVPLAIELAAAWTDVVSLPELLEELGDRLDLTARLADVPERQRSVRASCDWSYGLLNPAQQELLRGVSVFKGGFHVQAAEAVLERKGLRLSLAELVDRSWLYTRELDGRTRFLPRDLLSRQYALEQLRAVPECEARVQAHIRYFGALLEEQAQRLGSAEHSTAFSQLLADLEDIYEALDAALDRAEPDLLRPFAARLGRLLDAASRSSERLFWFERTVQKARELQDADLLTLALQGFGQALWRASRQPEALAALSEAREVVLGQNDPERLGRIENDLGLVWMAQGDCKTASPFLAAALETARRLAHPRDVAVALLNIAETNIYLERRNEARLNLEEAHEILTSETDSQLLNHYHNLLAYICSLEGEHAAAASHHGACIDLQRARGDRRALAEALLKQAESILAQPEPADVLAQLAEAERIFQDIGDDRGIAYAWQVQAQYAFRQGDFASSLSSFRQGLELQRRARSNWGVMHALNGICLTRLRLGELPETEVFELLELATATGNAEWQIAALLKCAALAAARGQSEPAGALLAGVEAQARAHNYRMDVSEEQILNSAWNALAREVDPAALTAFTSTNSAASLADLRGLAERVCRQVQ